MCIIAIKPAGIAMPDGDTIRNMWDNNHDGAGLMFATGKYVYIDKGYMRLKPLQKRLAKLASTIDITNTTVVLHFRIGTAGDISEANTHPFPVYTNIAQLQEVTQKAPIACAHNGIIPILTSRHDISDTMEYITKQLALLYQCCPTFYQHKEALKMIENATDSKWVFLLPNGCFYTVGYFQHDKGILYSNSSYEPYYYKARDNATSYTHRYGNEYLDYDYKKKQWEYPTQSKAMVLSTSADLDKQYKEAGHYKQKHVCFLDPNKEYIAYDNTGSMDTAEDYVIDSEGNLYWFDWRTEVAVLQYSGMVKPTCEHPTVYDKNDSILVWCDIY